MPEERYFIYWDACVWTSYIGGVPERLPILDAILDRSADRRDPTALITATLSITEVAYAAQEKSSGRLDPRVLDRIDQLWADTSVVQLVEFHDLIARDARELVRRAMEAGQSLKPADAIHLATAQRMGVVEFHTYDERLRGKAFLVKFPLMEPRTSQARLFDVPVDPPPNNPQP